VLEPKLRESLLGVKVTREKYMLKNDQVCGYLVKKNSLASVKLMSNQQRCQSNKKNLVEKYFLTLVLRKLTSDAPLTVQVEMD
jgi:hypothetical protein